MFVEILEKPIACNVRIKNLFFEKIIFPKILSVPGYRNKNFVGKNREQVKNFGINFFFSTSFRRLYL
jgi:hypothetical protein